MDNTSILIVAVVGIFAVMCLTPIIVTGILMVLTARKLSNVKQVIDKIVIPDQSKLREQFHQLQTKRPDLPVNSLVWRIIFIQATKSGLIGFIVGLGGVVTVPVNVTASVRNQAATIHLIAYTYGSDESDEAMKITTYAIMTGNQAILGPMTQVMSRIFQRLLLQMLGRTALRTFLEAVPLVGGLVGLVLNALFTILAGYLAIRWYTNPDRQRFYDKALQAYDEALINVASGNVSALASGAKKLGGLAQSGLGKAGGFINRTEGQPKLAEDQSTEPGKEDAQGTPAQANTSSTTQSEPPGPTEA